ncbi:MAG: AEC family transporter [Desulfamplus sp.]|nr:AEC family transporter [Desulfamplus sp.]MBF0411416.1 AEC family transporter [Desulfamplus sp.]
MRIVATIIPIFMIIFIGWFIKKRDFMPPAFLMPANKIVYYIAIPAMIFSAVAKASFHDEFNIKILLITFASLFFVAISAWLITAFSGIPENVKGTFIQSSFHGNFGYIGLAVVFYYLGDSGFANASIFAGFIMILQNILAVAVLQCYSGKGNNKRKRDTLKSNLKAIVRHPIILSAIVGIIFSLSEIQLPMILDRTLSILSGMALPLALLLIGATISFNVIRSYILQIVEISVFKLILMPAVGVLLFRLFSIPSSEYLPALILLASPTATMVYVMAQEMDGEPDFAVGALSACTMLSAVSFTIWLNILS